MWRLPRTLLRQTHYFRYCTTSSSANASFADEVAEKFKLPDKVLPSLNFLGRLNDSQQGKVARIIAELEAIYRVIEEVPKEINETHWQFMLTNTYQIYDRQEYLRGLYFHETNVERLRQETERRQLLLGDQQKRFDRGEMVYDKGFHELFSIRGQDFRRLLDCNYGNSLWLREKLDDGIPRIFVDCRFLHKLNQTWLIKTLNDFQRLHTSNWANLNPLQIAFSNYLIDDRIAQAAKSTLKFFYGPRATSDESIVENEFDDEQQDEKPFVQAPFYPHLTSRSFSSILPPNVKKDEIAYVTRLGTKFLDDEAMNRCKVFVVPAFAEHLLASDQRLELLKSLNNEGIQTYQIPLDAHVNMDKKFKFLKASVSTSILRDLVSNRCNWNQAILNNLPAHIFVDPNLTLPMEDAKKIESYIRTSWNVEINHKMKQLIPPSHAKKNLKPTERVHKYTREERNQRRKEAVGG